MKNIILLLIFLCMAGATNAQTFEEFKKQRQQELSQMKQERKEALQALKKEYDDYIEKHDEAFAGYLEQEWKAFRLYKAERRLPEPKPAEIPRYKPDMIDLQTDEEQPEERKETPEQEKQEQPKTQERKAELPMKLLIPQETVVIDRPEKKPEDIHPIVQKSIPQDFRHDGLTITFYGRKLDFAVDPALRQFRLGRVSENTLSSAWSKLSETEVSATIRQGMDYKEELNLNDWALMMLFEDLAEELTGSPNEKEVMTWFMMNKAGYNIRIAYAGNDLSLLIPATTQLYGVRYLVLDGKKYYINTPLNSEQIYTYDASYQLAQRDVDLHIHNPMMLGQELVKKTITFSHNGEEHQLPVVYNRSHVDFYQDYPITEIEVYLNAPVSEALKSSINSGLMRKVNAMDNEASVNFLLALAQKSFAYKTDPEQFGEEKFFFPEEVFHFPYSDCEDRSALFTYLIRELKGLDIVGLDYPGHLATAVKLEGAKGSYVNVGDERYIVADPTYINAPYGTVMPEFRNAAVKVVKVLPGELKRARHFWDIAYKANGFRGGAMKDYAFADDGTCYLTGYFTEKLDFGTKKLEGDTGKQAFVAAFTPQGDLKWAQQLTSSGKDAYSYGNAITLAEGNPVISGVYRGKLQAGPYSSQSSHNSWFVSMLEQEQPQWLNSLEIKEEMNNQRLVTSFTGSGKKVATNYYAAEDVLSTMDGLSYLDGNIVLNGNLAALPGAETKSYASSGEMDYVELLKTTNDQLLEENVDEAIAGLFAVTSLIQNSGYVIPGAEAQKALDKYNPQFRKKSPNIYESIGTIKFLKNSDGIVTILSDDKKIDIDKVRIKDKAQLKITPLPDGNHRVDMLSGIQVGKYFVWYDLNYIKMFRESGDLLFDYDDDHTHKVFNLKKDILY